MSEDTIFGKILRGEIPCDKVYEDDLVFAFRDINPAAPTHVLIIPRKPIVSMAEVEEEDEKVLGRMMVTASKIARQEGIDEDGYRLVVNCRNHGGQTVYHLHMHVLGGRAMSWPPG